MRSTPEERLAAWELELESPKSSFPRSVAESVVRVLRKEIYDSEQATQLVRVGGVIAQLIVGFCHARLRANVPEFHADELRAHIARHTAGCSAPGSADRLLRALRRAGKVSYVVVNRHQSLYRILSIQ